MERIIHTRSRVALNSGRRFKGLLYHWSSLPWYLVTGVSYHGRWYRRDHRFLFVVAYRAVWGPKTRACWYLGGSPSILDVIGSWNISWAINYVLYLHGAENASVSVHRSWLENTTSILANQRHKINIYHCFRVHRRRIKTGLYQKTGTKPAFQNEPWAS